MSEQANTPQGNEAALVEVPAETSQDNGAEPQEYRRGSSWVAQVALALALAALAFTSWQWLQDRHRHLYLERELSEKLEQLNLSHQQALALAKNADERSTEANSRASLFEQKLAESQDQEEAFQTLYMELANNQEERTIVEVEQLLVIANEQLQLAGNVKPALIALQTADSRLQQLSTGQALQLRKSIAADIQKLQNLPAIDTVGISLKLENLADSVDSLPLVSERHPAAEPVPAPEWDSSPWRRLAQEIWHDLRTMVRLERVDRPEPPLLAPEQNFFLRENIKLHLLTARIALLQHDESTYRADLTAAEKWLRGHFDEREQSTQTALATIKELSAKNIVIDVPDVSESLGLVSKYKLSLERQNVPGHGNNTEKK